jgi:phenylalanine ammonia-lyase
VQAVELRARDLAGHFDSRACLSPATAGVYEAIHAVLDRPISRERPLVWDDNEGFLETLVVRILADIGAGGRIRNAVFDGPAAPI